jgi:hypothetical protein
MSLSDRKIIRRNARWLLRLTVLNGFSATLFKYIGPDNSSGGGYKNGDLVYAIRGISDNKKEAILC